jgi:ABC-2 type transport system permease protein
MPSGGLTKAAGRGDARIQLLIDAQNATKARAVESYIVSIAQRFIAEYFPGAAVPYPVSFDVRVLYNPTLETSFYMVPGVMAMIMTLVTVMLTGMSLAREKEMGTFETIIAAPLLNREIVLGKTVPFVVLGMMNAVLVMGGGVIIFGVPVRGSILLMLLAGIVFVITTVSIGILISTFSRNQQQAMMGSFLFIFPANLLSGIMFPIENMPLVIRFFAYINPMTYFVRILRNIMLKGANPELVWANIAILAAMAAIVIGITIRRFRQTLN